MIHVGDFSRLYCVYSQEFCDPIVKVFRLLCHWLYGVTMELIGLHLYLVPYVRFFMTLVLLCPLLS